MQSPSDFIKYTNSVAKTVADVVTQQASLSNIVFSSNSNLNTLIDLSRNSNVSVTDWPAELRAALSNMTKL